MCRYINFCTQTPVFVQGQLTRPAWLYLNGDRRSKKGKNELRQAAINFLWYNLGPSEDGLDRAEQKARSQAFQPITFNQSALESDIQRKTAAIKVTLIGLKKANAVKRARSGQEFVLKSLPTIYPYNKLRRDAMP